MVFGWISIKMYVRLLVEFILGESSRSRYHRGGP
jgi:hypothetical protein